MKKYLIIITVLLTPVLLDGHAFAACSGAGGGGAGGGPTLAGSQGSAGCVSGGGGGGGSGGSGNGGTGGDGAGGGVLLKSTSGTITVSGTIDTRGGNSTTTNGGTVKLFSCSFGTLSGISDGRTYQASPGGGNCPPSAPTLNFPVNTSNGNSVVTTFQLRSSDPESDYLKYWVDVCSDSSCNTIVRTICQTNSGTGVPGTCTPSQTGWASQNTQSGTAYSSSTTLTLSTLATLNYQPPYLTANTQYWWRGYAIDPGGSNTWGPSSTINSFYTAPTETHIQGNVQLKGNVKL